MGMVLGLAFHFAVFSSWIMLHFTDTLWLPQFQTSHLLLMASVLEASETW